MKSKRRDSLKVGLIIGLFAPVIGFIIYGLYWSWNFNRTLGYFYEDLFIGTPAYRSSILSLSILINLIPFFIFIRKEKYQTARGVLLAVFVYVPFVIYFKFA